MKNNKKYDNRFIQAAKDTIKYYEDCIKNNQTPKNIGQFRLCNYCKVSTIITGQNDKVYFDTTINCLVCPISNGLTTGCIHNKSYKELSDMNTDIYIGREQNNKELHKLLRARIRFHKQVLKRLEDESSTD